MNLRLAFLQNSELFKSAPDLNGGGGGTQAWWEAPYADIKSLGRAWPIKSLVFPRVINIYDVIL